MRGLKSSSLLRNVLAVGSGAAAGQAVVFAFSPLITRIYSPEVFGLQGVFLSLISILSPAITLRYPMAIVVAKDEVDAQQLARLSLLIAFGMSCLLGLILLVGQQTALMSMVAETLGPLIWFLPIALFFVGLLDVADFCATRFGAFRTIGIATVTQAFLTNMARVIGGLVSPVATVLIAVTSLAPLTQSAMLKLGNRKWMRPASSLTRAEAITLLKQHRDFPIYRMPNDVLNAISQSVPVILLAALFSPAAAGLYTLTRSALNLPSNIIGTAVGNVLYVRFAELAREDEALMPLLLRSTAALLALAPVIIGLAWFAPPVFTFVFGEEWREAGYYARWMSLWIAMAIANVPATRIIPVIGQQRLSLFFNVVLLIARVLSLFGVYWLSGGALMAVASFSLISTIMTVTAILIFTWCTIKFEQDR